MCNEIVLKVYMHCEGCKDKVSKCLRGFDGNRILQSIKSLIQCWYHNIFLLLIVWNYIMNFNWLLGVEDVVLDRENHKVIVRGQMVDPIEILGRLRKKYSRNAELISPIPKPQSKENKEDENKEDQVCSNTSNSLFLIMTLCLCLCLIIFFFFFPPLN